MPETLFDLPAVEALTAADLDEWIAEVKASNAAYYFPSEWARAALAATVGTDPERPRWTVQELLDVLRRARRQV
jgi:hypothetical protein